jgi:cysteinyl-tRNA synthetase
LEREKFAPGASEKFASLAEETKRKMTNGLEDDMNTAVALAAAFDMVREVNAAADAGEVKQGDVQPLLAVLQHFDQIFDVISDGDAETTRAALEWGKSAGRLTAEQLRQLEGALDDSQVEVLVAARTEAKKSRDFARSDAIRKQLADAGIQLEDTKDGVRWKRK